MTMIGGGGGGGYDGGVDTGEAAATVTRTRTTTKRRMRGGGVVVTGGSGTATKKSNKNGYGDQQRYTNTKTTTSSSSSSSSSSVLSFPLRIFFGAVRGGLGGGVQQQQQNPNNSYSSSSSSSLWGSRYMDYINLIVLFGSSFMFFYSLSREWNHLTSFMVLSSVASDNDNVGLEGNNNQQHHKQQDDGPKMMMPTTTMMTMIPPSPPLDLVVPISKNDQNSDINNNNNKDVYDISEAAENNFQQLPGTRCNGDIATSTKGDDDGNSSSVELLKLNYGVGPDIHHHVEKFPCRGYLSQAEMDNRHKRFPSIQERVKVYMSNWYLPPCSTNRDAQIIMKWYDNNNDANNAGENIDNSTATAKNTVLSDFVSNNKQSFLIREVPKPNKTRRRVFRIDSKVKLNEAFYIDRDVIMACNFTVNKQYCRGTMTTILPTLSRIGGEDDIPMLPILEQYGDTAIARAYDIYGKKVDLYPNIPVIKKFRTAYNQDEIYKMTTPSSTSISSSTASTSSTEENDCNNNGLQYVAINELGKRVYQPIIWKQKFKRHFGMLDVIPKLEYWYKKKKDMAVFRGSFTGVFAGKYRIHYKTTKSDYEKCQLIPRCKLVYDHINSTLIDAMFTEKPIGDIVPAIVNGRTLYTTEKMSYRELLEYKAIIMPEGNDISTGLKWALFSNSVVMIPKPTRTAWAMEELLQPWIHYVPLASDFSDVEERMKWILKNEIKAREIAHRGSLWIRDLIFHPDAPKDEELIFDEILHRIRKHYYVINNESENEMLLQPVNIEETITTTTNT